MKDLNDVEDSLNECTTKAGEYENRLGECASDLADANEQNRGLEEKLELLGEKCDKAAEDARETEIELEEIKGEFDSLQDAHDKHLETIDDLLSTIKDNVGTSGIIDSLRTKFSECEAERSQSLKREEDAIKRENEVMAKLLDVEKRKDKELSDLREEYELLLSRYNAFEEDANTMKTALIEATTRVSLLEETNAKLVRSNKDTAESMDTCKREMESLQGLYDSLLHSTTSDSTALRDVLRDAEDKLNACKSTSAENAAEAESLNAELQDALEDIEDLNEGMVQVRSENRNLRGELSAKESESQTLALKLETLKKTAADCNDNFLPALVCQGDCSVTCKKTGLSRAEESALRAQLAELQSRLKSSEDDLSFCEKQKSNMQAELVALSQNGDAAVATLQRMLETAQASMNSCQRSAQAEKSRADQAQTELEATAAALKEIRTAFSEVSEQRSALNSQLLDEKRSTQNCLSEKFSLQQQNDALKNTNDDAAEEVALLKNKLAAEEQKASSAQLTIDGLSSASQGCAAGNIPVLGCTGTCAVQCQVKGLDAKSESALRNQLSEASSLAQSTQNKLDESKSANTALQVRIDALTEELKSTSSGSESAISLLSEELNAKQALLAKCEDGLETETRRAAGVLENLQNVQRDLDTSSEANKVLKSNLSAEKAKAETCKDEMLALQARYNRLGQTKMQLDAEYADQGRMLANEQTVSKELRAAFERLDASSRACRSTQLPALSCGSEGVVGSSCEVTCEERGLDSDLENDLRDRVSACEQSKEDIADNLVLVASQKSDLQKRYDDLQIEFKTVTEGGESALASVGALLETAQASLSSCEDALGAANDQKAGALSQLSVAKSERDSARAESTQLRSDLSAEEQRSQMCMTSKITLQQERDSISSALSSAEAEYRRLQQSQETCVADNGVAEIQCSGNSQDENVAWGACAVRCASVGNGGGNVAVAFMRTDTRIVELRSAIETCNSDLLEQADEAKSSRAEAGSLKKEKSELYEVNRKCRNEVSKLLASAGKTVADCRKSKTRKKCSKLSNCVWRHKKSRGLHCYDPSIPTPPPTPYPTKKQRGKRRPGGL